MKIKRTLKRPAKGTRCCAHRKDDHLQIADPVRGGYCVPSGFPCTVPDCVCRGWRPLR